MRFLRALPPLTNAERNVQPRGDNPVVGVRRNIGLEIQNAGGVRTLSSGVQVWQLSIRSPEAAAIRVHFQNFDAGRGRVWIYDGGANPASRKEGLGPWTDRGIFGSGEFWSGAIWSDTVTIEYSPAAGIAIDSVPPFTVDAIGHLWWHPAAAGEERRQQENSDPAASCNLDVSCYPSYATVANASVAYDFEAEVGVFESCSGQIIGTRSSSFLPYMLTANHCVSTEATAQTVEAYFFYRTAKCGDTMPDENDLQFAFGTDYINGANFADGDYSLLLFQEPAPPGTTFAGWTTTEPAVGDAVASIHHPQGSWSKITFGHRTIDQTIPISGGATAPASDYFQVAENKGVVEPGSSGGMLLNSSNQIVGTLTASSDRAGSNVCQGGETAVYGRFSQAYSGLKSYLEDTLPSSLKVSANSLSFTSDDGQLTGPSQQAFTVTTTSTSPVSFSVVPVEPWVTVSVFSGSVSALTPLQISVTVDPSFFAARGTQSTQIQIDALGMKPVTVTVSLNVKFHSVVSAVITPDPVFESGGSWTYRIVLTETAGAATTLTSFNIDGHDYSSQIASFFGSTSLPAHGTLTATMSEKGLAVPATRQFNFGGTDTVTGVAWTASAAGLFLGTASAPTTVFSHLAAGAGWETDMVLSNPTGAAIPFTLTFHADGGGPVTIENLGLAAQISDTLQPWQSKFYPVTSMGGGAGWADVSSAAAISGVSIFQWNAPDYNYYEGSVPLAATGHGFSISFDSTASATGTFETGIGITNADPQNGASITCQVYDEQGHELAAGLQVPALAPFGHTSFILQTTPPFESAVANARGLLVCSSSTKISAIGLRVLGYAISSLPVTITP